MNRLTRRTEDGRAYIQLYADPEGDPREFAEEAARKNREAIEKLALYEDLEEKHGAAQDNFYIVARR